MLQFHIATDIATEISIMKFQSQGLIFARCNMQYCCSSTFWQVKFPDAALNSVRYTPQICQKNWTRWDVRWSTPDKQSVIPPNLSDEVTKIRCEMKYPARLSDIPPSPNIDFSCNFTLLLTSSGQECFTLLLTISHCWHLVVKNGNAHCYWHLVVKNGNFTLATDI